ncbi:MAG: DUF4922 domain-containing protein [Acidobacteria bacterium]|nr:DUF4922 domain-containing protein [Acidobacteriota bacterium]
MDAFDRSLLDESTLDLADVSSGDPPLGRAIRALVRQQEDTWPRLPAAREHWFRSIYREVPLGSFSVLLQHNAMREESVSARVDRQSIAQRPCFLCPENMPPAERGLAVYEDFALFLNPYPILYPHPVIVHRHHVPQRIAGCFQAMLFLARECRGEFTMLYNGPRCGASAPDHLHFQGIPRYRLPVEADVHTVRHDPRFHHLRDSWTRRPAVEMFSVREYGRTVIVMISRHQEHLHAEFESLLQKMPGGTEETEPMINVLVWYEDDEWCLCLFPRRKHRPSIYSVEPGKGILLSPGAIDMGGLLITPRLADYERLTPGLIRDIFREVSQELTGWPDEGATSRQVPIDRRGVGAGTVNVPLRDRVEPELAVGIMENRAVVEFCLPKAVETEGQPVLAGWFRAEGSGDGLTLRQLSSGKEQIFHRRSLRLKAGTGQAITLRDVTIGIDFHWQQQRDFSFPGDLEIRPVDSRRLTVVNHLPLEEYLACVVASEMSAAASDEFLRAHAIISRSWLLAQLAIRGQHRPLLPDRYPSFPGQVLHWTERSRHESFDVCADDHCQRYQGVVHIRHPEVRRAVKATRGMVLAVGEHVCDTRFSKCCGGVSERYRIAWGDLNPPGIDSVPDRQPSESAVEHLWLEEAARRWILDDPPAYCNTSDPEILSSILPDFDQQTRDFYRWQVRIPRIELEDVIRRKTGWNPGELVAIRPVLRGHSGRLARVLLVGSRDRLLIGKELEIRRALSASHLYSSAFIVRGEPAGSVLPDVFEFRGAGWGHGAGLCQIGAAVMARQGFTAPQILRHYFPEARLVRWYD